MKLKALIPAVEEQPRNSAIEIPQVEYSGSPRVGQRRNTWNDQAMTVIPKVAASESWWLGKNLDEFAAAVRAQHARLSNSRLVEPFKAGK